MNVGESPGKSTNQRYRKISCRIWFDPEFLKLSDLGQLVCFFVLTNPNLGPVGAMWATIEGLAAQKRMPESLFRAAFEENIALGIVEYDEAGQLLALPNFNKHNRPENPNVIQNRVKCFDELPECALRTKHFIRFMDFVATLDTTPQTPYRKSFLKGLEDVDDTLRQTLSKGFPKPFPKQEQEQEQEQDTSLPPMTAGGGGNSFSSWEKSDRPPRWTENLEATWIIFWNLYPRDGAAGRAMKVWKQLEPDAALMERIIDALNRFIGCESWTKDGGTKIPYAAKWLDDKGWLSEGMLVEEPKKKSAQRTGEIVSFQEVKDGLEN